MLVCYAVCLFVCLFVGVGCVVCLFVGVLVCLFVCFTLASLTNIQGACVGFDGIISFRQLLILYLKMSSVDSILMQK